MSPRTHLVVPLLAAALLLPGCAATATDSSSAVPDPSQAVQTQLPGLSTPSGEPEVSSMATMSPSAGQLVQAPGPFDDRFRFDELRLDKGTVTGSVTVTSDVSELLELQVVAGFHDEQGTLLGTERFTHHLEATHAHDAGEAHGHESGSPGATPFPHQDFRLQAPAAYRDRVVSASVGVPVLVNE